MSGNVGRSRNSAVTGRAAWVVLAVLLALATACTPVPPEGGASPGTGSPTAAPGAGPLPPGTGSPGTGKPGHVFVINLENKGYDAVWGSGSAAPYLSTTLRAQGVLLARYYGIAHHSTPNYLAQISGQAANEMTRDDCPGYAPFIETGIAAQGQVQGSGCVYPASVPTLPGQLSAAGITWKGYMEDMKTPCLHPALGAKDDHQNATAEDQYATRHNPFVYFEQITSSPDCRANVVDFAAFAADLRSLATTPALSYITPNLCHDGHDLPCADGSPGGLASADAWLREQIPAIQASPAFKKDGLLVITFDEAEGDSAGPPGIPGGTAGGLTGALVLSPFTKAGTTSETEYNHYSLLASIEDIFSLPRLGYAGAPGLKSFGPDVFKARS